MIEWMNNHKMVSHMTKIGMHLVDIAFISTCGECTTAKQE
jgi:hypothetical protein